MRFTSILVAGVLAVAASAKTTATASLEAPQSTIEACIAECDPADIACLARCNPVPNPDEDQIEATHACVAKCDQGNGTQEQTDKYAECINACIKENYYDATQGTPKPTGAAGSDDDDEDTTKPDATTDSNAKPTDDSDSPSSSGTGVAPNKSDSEEKPSGTESADGKATESGDGDGAATGLVASSAALFGVVAAILAL